MIAGHSESIMAPDWWGAGAYPVERHSKSTIVAAGKVLAGKPALDDSAVKAFRVAHDWRSSHVVPMRHMRGDLSRQGAKVVGKCVTAARLKRMQSIRKKLSKARLTLVQIQDIAGCRAIVPSITDVIKLSDYYCSGHYRHELMKIDDYVAEPRDTGYRGIHLVFKYVGQGDFAAYDRQRVEIQLRSAEQHAWATAVEAVGLVRNEDLKGGAGDADWLRLFQLMSDEFAKDEGRNAFVAEGARRSEIIHLNEKLSAASNLARWNASLKYTERFASSSAYKYYLIQFNGADNSLSVTPFSAYQYSYNSYISEEQGQHSGRNTVLVEVDRIGDLRAAYPNYFLDVEAFTLRLWKVVRPDDEQPFFTPESAIKVPRIDLRGTRWGR